MSNRHFLSALMTLILAAVLVLGSSVRREPVVLRTNLERLPLEIAGYRGSEDRFPAEVYEVLNADLHVYRHYRATSGEQMDLYIGYYGTAKGGRSTHNPYACLPGAGWGILEAGKVTVKAGDQPAGVDINYVVSAKDGIFQVLYHWYQTDGSRVLSSGLEQNIHRFVGRLSRNRSDGAYIQVSTMADERTVDQAKESVKSFAERVLELLPGYWPEEG